MDGQNSVEGRKETNVMLFICCRVPVFIEILAQLRPHPGPVPADAGGLCGGLQRGDEVCLRGTADGSLLGIRGTSTSGDLSHPDGGVPIPRNHVNGECKPIIPMPDDKSVSLGVLSIASLTGKSKNY